ncbi:type IV pilin-like G/H family protein [Nodosilinea sp. LEGE 07298]|uniref:type IV pilin-like G/H family protein n=1 Tax=Nodosilinea sp. LEGE 07298 TaxID=2777970 RepID=UPI00187ECDFF|nr:type IV pilin-like G/H family protein [Nodosilinea sp. LEGE 07298]MBE9111949.1 type IV pilin-like G/H family protein [Nodosilinea sp. LEGE 07298]
MKTSLKANLLKHLVAKKEEGGFTLIELLVVIIIIGILAAIALPSFLNQANKARQSEAKTYVGSMNRGQQAYRLENPEFAPDFVNLAIGIPSNTTYYNYDIDNAGVGGATALAEPVDVALKSYAGGVQLTTGAGGQDATTLAILCESEVAATPPTVAAINVTTPQAATAVVCDGGFKEL